MTAAFQKATGIPVKLDDNSTGPQSNVSSPPSTEPGGCHVFAAPAGDAADPGLPTPAPAAGAAPAGAAAALPAEDAAPDAGTASLNRR